MTNPTSIAEVFPLIDRIKQQSDIVRMTTGKKPTHIVMNIYTYRRLLVELYAVAKVAHGTCNTAMVNGLTIAVTPEDSSKEEKLEIL